MNPKDKNIIGKDINEAAHWLEQGETVAIPTETVYGLAANALNEAAVHKIFAVKGRPLYNPLIVHIKDIAAIDTYAKEIPDLAYTLLEAFAPGPLTLILPKKSIVPDLVTAGLPHVALRIPNHPLTLALLAQLTFPLAAPSANPFGYISPTTATHVAKQLAGKIPYILDGGPCQKGLESTIIGFTEGVPVLHRVGALGLDAIKKFIPDIKILDKAVHKPVGPGMLAHHYSPHTKLELSADLEDTMQSYAGQKIGIISLSKKILQIETKHQVQLSLNNDLEEAATQLYAAMHYLDNLGLDIILVEPMPKTGMGIAINDRLERAAAK
jgi:L-threonylcarbamoyladenylate synthase